MVWYISVVPSNTILRLVVECVDPGGEVVRLGARWVTDEDALQRFVQHLTPKADSTPAPRTQAARVRVDRELDRRGL